MTTCTHRHVNASYLRVCVLISVDSHVHEWITGDTIVCDQVNMMIFNNPFNRVCALISSSSSNWNLFGQYCLATAKTAILIRIYTRIASFDVNHLTWRPSPSLLMAVVISDRFLFILSYQRSKLERNAQKSDQPEMRKMGTAPFFLLSSLSAWH